MNAVRWKHPQPVRRRVPSQKGSGYLYTIIAQSLPSNLEADPHHFRNIDLFLDRYRWWRPSQCREKCPMQRLPCRSDSNASTTFTGFAAWSEAGVKDPGHGGPRSPWNVLICSKHVCRFIAEAERDTHRMSLRTVRCSRPPLTFAHLARRGAPREYYSESASQSIG